MFFSVMFLIFENKRWTGYVIIDYSKMKLFSGAISHDASNEPGGVFRTHSNVYEGPFLQICLCEYNIFTFNIFLEKQSL